MLMIILTCPQAASRCTSLAKATAIERCNGRGKAVGEALGEILPNRGQGLGQEPEAKDEEERHDGDGNGNDELNEATQFDFLAVVGLQPTRRGHRKISSSIHFEVEYVYSIKCAVVRSKNKKLPDISNMMSTRLIGETK
jgi:hypothetical protein